MRSTRLTFLTLCRYTAFLSIMMIGLISIIATGSSSSSDNGNDTPSVESGSFSLGDPWENRIEGDSGHAPVERLDYETSGGTTGTTDSEGSFEYEDGDTVTFSIGGIVIGQAAAQPVVTLSDLIGNVNQADREAVNIARLFLNLHDGSEEPFVRLALKEDAVEDIRAIMEQHTGPAVDFGVPMHEFENHLRAVLGTPELELAIPLEMSRAFLANATNEPETPDILNPVNTAQGPVIGFEKAQGIGQWLGIPYAWAPVGDLRWKPPMPLGSKLWGDNDEYWPAWAYAPMAAQFPVYMDYGQGGMSEDCLYLNITAPLAGDSHPVMVWFHGGAFGILTNSTPSYNNAYLAEQDVVLVTVNHRLGAFGYLAHPELSAESQDPGNSYLPAYDGSGNYGQMDLVAALDWIQDNIHHFGGDPNNVTLFGQSGGGGKAQALMASDMVAEIFEEDGPLFHRAISMSGMAEWDDSTLSGYDSGTAEFLGTLFSGQAADMYGTESIEDIRGLPWEDVEKVYRFAALSFMGMDPEDPGTDHSSAAFIPAFNQDGLYMMDTLENVIKDEQYRIVDVPFMGGITSYDVVAGMDLRPGILDQMSARIERSDQDHHVYLFSHVPGVPGQYGWADEGINAYHGVELVYLFGDPESFVSHYLLGLTDGKPEGLSDPMEIIGSTGYFGTDGNPTQQELDVTGRMMMLWTEFARTGNPTGLIPLDWEPATNDDRNYLHIDQGGEMYFSDDYVVDFEQLIADIPVE